MRSVHAASLCEKTTLPLQKRNLKPKACECNSNDKMGDWLNAQVSKFRLLLFSRQLRVSNYDIYWTNQNARLKRSCFSQMRLLYIFLNLCFIAQSLSKTKKPTMILVFKLFAEELQLFD